MPTNYDSDYSELPPPEKARILAKKSLERLRELYRLYPSDDLKDAIRSLETWHEKHLGSDFQPPPLE